MSKEKHRQQGEMQQMTEDHYKTRTNRKSGITKSEWEKELSRENSI